MKNCWNQEIKVGSVVYRGARLRNGSEYKMGVVLSIDGQNPRVEWKYKAYSRWIKANGDTHLVPYMYACESSKGSPTLESLFVVGFDMTELDRQAAFHKSIDRDTEFRSVQDFYDALDNYQI